MAEENEKVWEHDSSSPDFFNDSKRCNNDAVHKIASFLTVGGLSLFTQCSKRLKQLTQDDLRIYQLRRHMLTCKSLKPPPDIKICKQFYRQKGDYNNAYNNAEAMLEDHPCLVTQSPKCLSLDDLNREHISTFQWSLRLRVPDMQLLLLDQMTVTDEQKLHATFLIHLLNSDTETVADMLKEHSDLVSVPLKMGNLAGKQYEGMSAFKVALRHTCVEVAEVILEALKPTLTAEQQEQADLFMAVMRDQHNKVNEIVKKNPALAVMPLNENTENPFEGYSPIQLAAYKFNRPMVRSMMNRIKKRKENTSEEGENSAEQAEDGHEQIEKKLTVEADSQLKKMTDFYDWRIVTIYQACDDNVKKKLYKFYVKYYEFDLVRHLGSATIKAPMWLRKLMNKWDDDDWAKKNVSTSAINEEVKLPNWWGNLGVSTYAVRGKDIVLETEGYYAGRQLVAHDREYVTELMLKRICEMQDYCPQLAEIFPSEALSLSIQVLG